VFTTFEGRLGAVDERLLAEGRLRKLSSADELVVEKRARRMQDRVRRDPRELARLMLSGLH
jgi:hypothetical protein